MVVVYRVSALTYGLIEALRHVGLFGWEPIGAPNLLIGRGTVPELLQRNVRADRVAKEAWSLLASPDRMEEMQRALGRAAAQVSGAGSLARAAEVILQQTSR